MFDFGGAMNIEIKNLVKYIKHNSIKSSDEIIGMLIRSKKKNKLGYHYRFSDAKTYEYKYLGYIRKKEYKLLKRKKIFKYTSHGNSSYVGSYNYIFRISSHWGELLKSNKKFSIDVLDKSAYKNNYGMTRDFDNTKIFLVGICKRSTKI